MNTNHKLNKIQQNNIQSQLSKTDSYRFFNLLTSSELLSTVEAQLPEHRERLYPPTVTLSFPETLNIRELKAGKKIIITTILSDKSATKKELAKLYKQRWHVELDLRNIKTTLGMEVLSCKTPEMNEKEMWVYFLAYNLIRLIMTEAAAYRHIKPRQISFKHTLQLWLAWNTQTVADDKNMHALLIMIAQVRVNNRPGRCEPRAVKRRPKPHPLLMKPRSEAREDILKNGHP